MGNYPSARLIVGYDLTKEDELMNDSLRYELVSDVINEMSDLSKYRIYYDLQQEL